MEESSIIALIAFIPATITAITLVLTYRQNARRDKPEFELTALNSDETSKPSITIYITNPTKPIKHCQVLCDGVVLKTPFGGGLRDWIYINTGGSAAFLSPEGIDHTENTVITIKNGKQTLQEITLKELSFPL